MAGTTYNQKKYLKFIDKKVKSKVELAQATALSVFKGILRSKMRLVSLKF